ncbi:hypothetical protein Gotur_001842 [Gossypium turneri]
MKRVLFRGSSLTTHKFLHSYTKINQNPDLDPIIESTSVAVKDVALPVEDVSNKGSLTLGLLTVPNLLTLGLCHRHCRAAPATIPSPLAPAEKKQQAKTEIVAKIGSKKAKHCSRRLGDDSAKEGRLLVSPPPYTAAPALAINSRRGGRRPDPWPISGEEKGSLRDFSGFSF